MYPDPPTGMVQAWIFNGQYWEKTWTYPWWGWDDTKEEGR